MSNSSSCPVDAEQAAWLQGSVSIVVGSRDGRFRPHLMRGIGCRVSADRRRAVVLISAGSGQRVLDDIRANAAIAVVFTQPSTNRALQLKGSDASVAACSTDDARLAAHYLQSFVDEVGQLGFAADIARNILAHQNDLMAIEFGVDAAFDQTPGPQAGQSLGTTR